jgi:hypothetical protein
MPVQDVDVLVSRMEKKLGRATATSFVDPDADDRFFLLEALLSGAMVFLLNVYFEGFFKPVEEMGNRHRKLAIRLLEALKKKNVPEDLGAESRSSIGSALKEAPQLDSPERRRAAEDKIEQILQDYGESAAQATRKAAVITEVIFGN